MSVSIGEPSSAGRPPWDFAAPELPPPSQNPPAAPVEHEAGAGTCGDGAEPV